MECKIIMGGRPFYVYKGEAISTALNQGIGYEAAVAHAIGGYVRRGDVCVDVGSNIGYHSLLMCTLMKGTGEVHSFEPGPRAFHLLNLNIDLNKHSYNWKGYELAVTDVEGKGSLTNPQDSCQTSFSFNKEGLVKSTTLDIKFERCPNIIKIDTEGSEVLVLRGMRRHLEADTNLAMMVEFCPTLLVKHGTTVEEFIHWMKVGRFRLYLIFGDGTKRVVASPDKLRLVAQSLPGDTELANLWCVR